MPDSSTDPSVARPRIAAALCRTLPHFVVPAGATSPIPPALQEACRTRFTWTRPAERPRYVWRRPAQQG